MLIRGNNQMNIDEILKENESEFEGPNTPIVYFLDLPLGDVIKVGTTTVTGLHSRRRIPQAYFVDDVNYLGIIYCETRSQAYAIEKSIKNKFGTSRSRRNDLIPDTCELRKFIELYFIDAGFDLEISEDLENERIRENRQ